MADKAKLRQELIVLNPITKTKIRKRKLKLENY